ncbi:MAG TPA: putative glycolipid-binding domain-containing protein [Telluria sp.]
MNNDAAPAVFLWRKLDSPGHDSCRFFSLADGYRLLGAAVFLEAGQACQLQYDVVADAGFRTTRAAVAGFVGNQPVDVRISATGQHWEVDGKRVPALAGCLDVDLGFTPATNLLPLRRLALHVGQEADAPASYLAFPAMQFTLLPQHYHRLSGAYYDYLAPGYRGTLRVSAMGAVEHYPGLFELLWSLNASGPIRR